MSFSSSSSQTPPQHQEVDSDPSSTTDDSKHQTGLIKDRKATKPLDLDSYFNDLPDQSSSRGKRPKNSISIIRSTRRALRLKGVPKSRLRRNTTLTVPPSRDEKHKYDDREEDDSDDEDEADAAWVRERWNQLMDRQRLAEADVRRTILNRDRLGPSELSRWLDSDETCTLPLPTLGVQLRMMKND
ncbi:hypothetical protein PCANC_07624 [Puccinia coronata f. sp. avenae]|uniref:Uncharacterized protein n=1 Tax=Puccinia coronata f. sp. avenae TaxID=200324 RepID=A0A2N5T2J9_9BASI|nr:hypothetical protein PCANC_07624 [Puccinia coronata f. sp. avenae]